MRSTRTCVRIHRAGLGAMLAAFWLAWMSNVSELGLWALFLAGLVAYVFPAEVTP